MAFGLWAPLLPDLQGLVDAVCYSFFPPKDEQGSFYFIAYFERKLILFIINRSACTVIFAGCRYAVRARKTKCDFVSTLLGEKGNRLFDAVQLLSVCSRKGTGMAAINFSGNGRGLRKKHPVIDF